MKNHNKVCTQKALGLAPPWESGDLFHCETCMYVWLPSKMVPLSAEYANPSLFLDIWPIIDIGDLIHQEVKGWKKNFIISSIEQSYPIAYSHWPIDGRPHNHFVDNLRQF